MTLLDRALTKAYSQRSLPERTPDAAPAATTTVQRGWVAKLRAPANSQATGRPRPAVIPSPSRANPPSAPEHYAPARETLSTPAPRPIVRIDPKHESIADTPSIHPAPISGWSWPSICEQLTASSAGPGIRGLASLLRELLAERGQRSVAFTGPSRGAGRTSLALTIARLITDDPALRLVLVDLDFGGPGIGSQLGITPDPDLWQAACGAVQPAAALLTLIPGRLSLLALRDRVRLAEVTPERAAAIRELLRGLRQEFDLLLVDLGPWDPDSTPAVAAQSAIETCVCVRRQGDQSDEVEHCERCRAAGIDVLGIVETFVRQTEPPESKNAR